MFSRNITFGSCNYSSLQGNIVKEESRFNKSKISFSFCFLTNSIPIHAGLAEYMAKIEWAYKDRIAEVTL
jgi:hypothetical protein